ncbi:MAG TPA: glycosyltransferase family 2 protein [Anaerolineales bacterium]|nr:glycosyltransferase family 2 protein [Anaerolineales bacterium]
MLPRITIITPSLNRTDLIGQAIESVINQVYSELEHIVMDAGSTDGTISVLSQYPHLITRIEPDRGLYDAINNGLRIASGEIVGLLNSDDYYEQGIFAEVASIFDSQRKIDVVIGGAGIFESTASGEVLVDRYPSLNEKALLDILVFGAPAINAWFFRRSVFDRVGNFDLAYPLGADRDFLIRLYLSGLKPSFVDKVFYHYRKHPGSLTINQGSDAQERILLENRRLAQKYISNVHADRALQKRSLRWHDLTSIELMILFARQRRLWEVTDVIRTAIKHNWAWLFVVIVQSPVRIINYLRKNHASSR